MDNEIGNEGLEYNLFFMAKTANEDFKNKCDDPVVVRWSKEQNLNYDTHTIGEVLKALELSGRAKALNALIVISGLDKEYKKWVCDSTSCDECYMECSDGICSALSTDIINEWVSSKSKTSRNSGMSELYNYVLDMAPIASPSNYISDMLENILDQSEKIECIHDRCEWLSKMLPNITDKEIRDILLR